MIKSVSRCRNGAGEQTGGLTVTDQEVIECLATEFSRYYRISPESIEKAFQIARGELGNGLHAYAATRSVLVRMFRDTSEPIWKISKETEKVMRKIISGK